MGCPQPSSCSIEDAVEALVIERPAGWSELFAKAACVRRHAVCLGGLTVAPKFDEREVVLPVGLRCGLKAKVAVILATVLGQLLDNRSAVLALRRDHVDVGYDFQRLPAHPCRHRPHR